MNKKLQKFFNVILITMLINAISTFVGVMIWFMIEFLPLWKVIVLTIISLFVAYLLVSATEHKTDYQSKV